MSRPVIRRALLALPVIAIASGPPALSPSLMHDRAAETSTQAGDRIQSLRVAISEELSETRALVLRLQEGAAARLAEAADYLSAQTESLRAGTDARINPETPVVVAALPPQIAQDPDSTASLPPVAFAPLAELSEPAEEAGAPALTASAPSPTKPDQSKIASLGREELALEVPETAAAPAPVAAVPVVEFPIAAQEIPVPVAALNPAPDLLQPAPASVPARREATDAPIVVQPKPTAPEEKQVFASLGRQATAVDMHPIPAPEPALAPASASAPPSPPEDVVEEPGMEFGHAAHGSRPLKLRALTRADIPSAEKLASLGGPLRGDARLLPPEQQRVAHDDPIMTEMPVSIGRRKWIDESKYKGLGSPEALLEALRHLGANAKTLGLPASLWCADFMNLVLRKSGIPATGSRAAKSYLQYGRKIDEPRVGAIAIFTRGKNGGHIGIVRGTDGNGNPIIVSGNHNNKVAEATYPKARVIAYVVPR